MPIKKIIDLTISQNFWLSKNRFHLSMDFWTISIHFVAAQIPCLWFENDMMALQFCWQPAMPPYELRSWFACPHYENTRTYLCPIALAAKNPIPMWLCFRKRFTIKLGINGFAFHQKQQTFGRRKEISRPFRVGTWTESNEHGENDWWTAVTLCPVQIYRVASGQLQPNM